MVEFVFSLAYETLRVPISGHTPQVVKMSPAAKAAQKPAPSPNNRQTRSMINPVEDLEYFIRLRFEWLMQPKNTDQNTAIDNKKIKDLLDANPNEGPLMAFSVHKGRALVTGDVFEMVSDNKNDLPRYEVLKLLVLLGRIRSIAGAAGPRADSPSSSTNTSEDGIANVEIGMRDINIQSDKGKTLENVPGEEAENGANNGERQRFWKRWVPNRKRSPSNSRVSQHTPAASPKQGTLRRRMSEISLKSRELLERFGRGNDDGQQASRNEAIREMASGAVETIPTIGEISLVDTSLEWPSQYRGSTPDPGWPTPGIPV
ncbi:hypothetical protein HER10_EVM0000921 [Colletotrichum scovillei]|uniref:uncharacterized protein n=1 Tax=Colletotrichum scovillei TaxID=1209932 RepID=UPI0015C2EC31|nr:uncharacterized protein HER10_EVM0000921 [Colletotrichum scovillei]KAF4782602.1 hypothetical protein HER10_EVM0000921 [Colletotrichum scovillei]